MKLVLFIFMAISLMTIPLFFSQDLKAQQQSQQQITTAQSDGVQVTTTTLSPGNIYSTTDWAKLLAFLGVASGVQMIIGRFYVKPMVRDEFDKFALRFISVEKFNDYKEAQAAFLKASFQHHDRGTDE